MTVLAGMPQSSCKDAACNTAVQGMIGGLQMLRGVAATLVVGFHLQAAALNEGFDAGLFALFRQGEAGVDVFFVLSGFVIFHAASQARGLTAGRFVVQRFWRIVPPYWCMLTLTVLALLALAGMRGDWATVPGPDQLFASVLLLPWPDQVMAIAWTLTVEALFYLIFAATFFRFGAGGALLALAVWAAVAQGAKVWPDGVPMVLALPLYSGVVEFLMGGLIARQIAKTPSLPAAGLAVFLGAFGLAAVVTGLIPLSLGREWVAGVPSALLVYGLAGGGWRMPGWTLIWGEASYMLYLSHLLVFSITGTVLRMAGMNAYAHPIALAGLMLLALLLAVAATVFLERPYRRWTRPRRAKEPLARGAA